MCVCVQQGKCDTDFLCVCANESLREQQLQSTQPTDKRGEGSGEMGVKGGERWRSGGERE